MGKGLIGGGFMGLIEVFVTWMGVFVSFVLFLYILILLYAFLSRAEPLKFNIGNGGSFEDLPMISVIVPAYREREFLPRVLKLISDLKYPRDRLQVILALEPDDYETVDALRKCCKVLVEGENGLPCFVEFNGLGVEIVYNRSGFRSKPAALNEAFKKVRGNIIGVYDAEDLPHPNHPLTAVSLLRDLRGRGVVAVQFVRFMNHFWVNRLSKGQAAEYEVYFKHVGPALCRLTGLPAVAGSAFFVFRNVLEEVGCWDPKMPTEDLDLTFKLGSRGYRVVVAEPAAGTEAVLGLRALLAQRARWVRGGFLVAFRALKAFPRSFPLLIIAVLMPLCSILGQTWLILPFLGVDVDPIVFTLPFVFSVFSYALTAKLAVNPEGRVPGRYVLVIAAVYTLAVWKAVFELLTKPYCWNKTPRVKMS